MSNSSLAVYIDTNTENCAPRAYKITRISIHHAAGVCSLEQFSSILRYSDASWNYGISNDGKIGLYVDEAYRAYTSCNYDNDNRAVTIEVSNSACGDEWPISEQAYQALVLLCEDICRRNNIEKLTYTGALEGSNVTLHQWFWATLCPGPYLKSKIPNLVADVNARLSLPSKITEYDPSNPTAYDTAICGSVEANQALVDTDDLKPYMITIDRKTSKLDYTKLKESGVVGAIVEAGCLYDVSHMERNYRNPKLDSQLKGLASNGIPFGLYTTVCARSVEEAEKEMTGLRFCIYQYPPVLGVWLKLNLVKSNLINNKIIDTYYEALVKLGLQDRVGIYATKEQLDKIDWQGYSDKFYLWWDNHVQDLQVISGLLTPSMFIVS